MIRLTVFIVLSIGLAISSRKSLWNRQAYGLYRFFTFELLLGLITLNARPWFTNPFSAIQIVSWVLLIGSIILAAQGFYLLHKFGQPARGIEDTTILIKKGVYKYIRHPLYSSLILLGWGAFLKDISWLPAILAILATIFSTATAMVEEKENLRRFGDEYASYMNSSKRFIPFLI